VDGIAEDWRNRTSAAGQPWCISFDEFTVDEGQSEGWKPVYVPDDYRKLKIWPIYLSGGQLEFILEDLLWLDDFTKYSKLWNETWYARKLIQDLPFWEMQPMDHLLSGATPYSNGHPRGSINGQVMAKPGVVYLVYLPNATSTGYLDLSGAPGSFELRWYNPRSGSFEGAKGSIIGGTKVGLGTPPSSQSQDWVALLEASGG